MISLGGHKVPQKWHFATEKHQGKVTMACLYCKKPGHKAKECFRNRKSSKCRKRTGHNERTDRNESNVIAGVAVTCQQEGTGKYGNICEKEVEQKDEKKNVTCQHEEEEEADKGKDDAKNNEDLFIFSFIRSFIFTAHYDSLPPNQAVTTKGRVH